MYYTTQELDQRAASESWTTAFGVIYDLDDFVHPIGVELDVHRQDVTHLFPRTTPNQLPEFCLNMDRNWTSSSAPVCDDNENDNNDAYCHESVVGKRQVDALLEQYRQGDVVLPPGSLSDDESMSSWIRIGWSLYNVTQYMDGLRDPITHAVDKSVDHPNAYLSPALHLMIVHKVNEDATDVYANLFGSEEYQL